MESENYSEYNKVTDSAVYFYTPRFYALDNFSSFAVEIWDKEFPTSEHAYQWKKYSVSHPDIANQILNAKSAHVAKKIADAHKEQFDPGWHEYKVLVMEEILRAKLTQHEKVQQILRETENREIIENSPTDSFWGIGPDGDGKNMVGKIWMRLRAELK